MSITVIAVTSRRAGEHLRAMSKTIMALSVIPQQMLILKAPWQIEDFNRYMLTDLKRHITTDFALTVHWDGFAINPHLWTDEFLNYDYIGAPWPRWITKDNRVGNGGFSLRSRRWIERAAELEPVGSAEDVYQCRTRIDHFLEKGLKVAPLELALRFAIENPIEEFPDWDASKSFGFHDFTAPGTEQCRLTPPTLKERARTLARRLKSNLMLKIADKKALPNHKTGV